MKCKRIPDSRWHVGNWSIVSHPPWTAVFAYDVRGKGEEGSGERGRRGEQRKGIDKDLLAKASSGEVRSLIYEWDPGGGERCRLAEPGTHSGARMDQSFRWSLLSRFVSLSHFFLYYFFLLSLLGFLFRYNATFSFFLFSRSILVAYPRKIYLLSVIRELRLLRTNWMICC